ncbi:hypothetical protein As57867_004662, partial [Aphanomyces stellatus]
MSFEHSKILNATSTDVQGLVLDTAAFIHEAPPGVTTISAVVQSNSKSLVDAFNFKEVQPKDNLKALDFGLEFSWLTTFSAYFNADYIVDIYVPSNMLQYVKLSGCGNVAVYPHVLANTTTQSLEARVTGS